LESNVVIDSKAALAQAFPMNTELAEVVLLRIVLKGDSYHFLARMSLRIALFQTLIAVSLMPVMHCGAEELNPMVSPEYLTYDYSLRSWDPFDNRFSEVIWKENGLADLSVPFKDSQSVHEGRVTTSVQIARAADAPRRLDIVLTGNSASVDHYGFAESESTVSAEWYGVPCVIFARNLTFSIGECYFSFWLNKPQLGPNSATELKPNTQKLLSGGAEFYGNLGVICGDHNPETYVSPFSSYQSTTSFEMFTEAGMVEELSEDPVSGCKIQVWICPSELAFKVLSICPNGDVKLVGACEFSHAFNEYNNTLSGGRFRWLNYEQDSTTAHNDVSVTIWEWDPSTGKLKKYRKTVPFVREVLKTVPDLGKPDSESDPQPFDTSHCHCGSSAAGRLGLTTNSIMMSYAPICSLSLANVNGSLWDYCLTPSQHIGARIDTGDRVFIEATGFVTGSVIPPASLVENGAWSYAGNQNGYLVFSATKSAYVTNAFNGFLGMSAGGTNIVAAKASTSGEWIGMTGVVAAPENIDRLEISRNGNRVAISWSTNIFNASIQWTGSISPSNEWTTTPAQPVVVNGKYTVNDYIEGKYRYYRMLRQ
jgi:hypothetical protein